MRVSRSFLLCACLLALATVQARAAAPHCYALLIGINAYQDKVKPTIQDLRYTHADCDLLKAILPELTGISAEQTTAVELFDLDATRASLEQALAGFRAVAQPDDVLVFYFSGHGSLVPDFDGDEGPGGYDGAMILANFNFEARPPTVDEVETGTLTDDWAAAQLAQFSDLRRVFYITDCCHSGGNAKEMDKTRDKGFAIPLPVADNPEQHTKAVTMLSDKNRVAQPNLICLFACDSSTTAQELTGNGALTWGLAEILRSPARYEDNADGKLDLKDLYDSLLRLVLTTVSRQNSAKHQAVYVQWLGLNDWYLPYDKSVRFDTPGVQTDAGIPLERMAGLEDLIRDTAGSRYDTGDAPYTETDFSFVEDDGLTWRREIFTGQAADALGRPDESLRVRVTLDSDAYVLPLVVNTKGEVFPLQQRPGPPFDQAFKTLAGQAFVYPTLDKRLGIVVEEPGSEYIVLICSPVPLPNPFADRETRQSLLMPLLMMCQEAKQGHTDQASAEKSLGPEMPASSQTTVDAPVPGKRLTVFVHRYQLIEL